MAQAAPENTPSNKPKTIQMDVALWIALVPVVAAAVRVWLFSGGETSVFLVLLRTLDITTVLVGTTVLLVPGVLGFGLVAFLTDWKARDWLSQVFNSNILVPGAFGVGTLIIAATIPWGVTWRAVAAGAVLIGSHFAVKRFWPRAHRKIAGFFGDRRESNRPDSLLTLVGTLLFVLVQPTTMWLPLEEVTDIQGSRQVAYVLESTSEWTTLLTADRKLSIVATKEVESRLPCRRMQGRSLAMMAADVYPAGVDCDAPTGSEYRIPLNTGAEWGSTPIPSIRDYGWPRAELLDQQVTVTNG